MPIDVKMPNLGDAVETVTLVNWLVQEGQPVQAGDAICEVETDKAATEIQSEAGGMLLRKVVPAGSRVAPGEIIAQIE